MEVAKAEEALPRCALTNSWTWEREHGRFRATNDGAKLRERKSKGARRNHQQDIREVASLDVLHPARLSCLEESTPLIGLDLKLVKGALEDLPRPSKSSYRPTITYPRAFQPYRAIKGIYTVTR